MGLIVAFSEYYQKFCKTDTIVELIKPKLLSYLI